MIAPITNRPDKDRLLPWLSLKSVPGVGNHLFKRLIDQFVSPERVFKATSADLLEVDGLTHRLVKVLRRHKVPGAVEKDLEATYRRGFRIVTQADPVYPALLREIPDPPPFLYVYGHLDGGIRNIAVVGSRHATHYGMTTARQLSASLGALDLTIVSGMAMGIDTAAHEGALDAGKPTVAVLGSGLGHIYPAKNRKLFHRIAENGAVVSEFSVETGPEAYNFPIRNRIISGMSLGTVVVEAARRSGSLITARLAAEQNREVFAVPGSIQSYKSSGAHALIKQGAKLVEHAGDIMEEFTHAIDPGRPRTTGERHRPEQIPLLTPAERQVFDLLSPYPVHIDDLVRKLDMAPGELMAILLQLELRGIVHQAPGTLFALTGKC